MPQEGEILSAGKQYPYIFPCKVCKVFAHEGPTETSLQKTSQTLQTLHFLL